jgi:putative transposase
VTKYRRAIFNEGIFAYFKIKLAEVTEHYPLIKIKEVNHDKDHIHMLVSIPPTMNVGKAVGLIKQNTARNLKQKFPFLKEVYWGTEAVWSEGYFVSTVGVNDKVIKKYIEDQGKKDTAQTMFEIS